jgi:hypothetical protein
MPERAPQPATTERPPEELATSIWEEVYAADEVVRPATLMLGDEDLPLVESWQTSNSKEAALAAGFRRGRQILQGSSYGRKYWEMEDGMDIVIDDSVAAGQHEGVNLGTKKLLQLVILSRVALTPVERDDHWHLPTFQDIQKVKQEVREELGVAEEHKRIWESEDAPMYPPEFPGIDGAATINAIVSGQLSVGRPEEPEAHYWQP